MLLTGQHLFFQQILGSGSSSSSFMKRLPPIGVTMVTRPFDSVFFTITPMCSACSPFRMLRQCSSTLPLMSGATTASMRPSHAKTNGSKPNISHTLATSGHTGILFSINSISKPVSLATSWSNTDNPPRVGSRTKRTPSKCLIGSIRGTTLPQSDFS